MRIKSIVARAAVLVVSLSGSVIGAAPSAKAALPLSDSSPITSAVAVERLAGPNRYETAVKIAQRSFPDSAATVYLARADVFADALAAGTLTDGPVLLVPSCGTPPEAVVDEIKALRPTTVIALGGSSSVCDAMLAQAAGSAKTERISGPNRYATAIAIANRRLEQAPAPTVVYVASGSDRSPDAVAGGVLTKGPILTVAPSGGPSVAAAAKWVADHSGIESATALGGTSAVSASNFATVAGSLPTARLSGANRYATAAAIAKQQFQAAPVAYLARGDVFADAVASGSLTDGPVFLTESCALPPEVAKALSELKPERIVALGGTSSVCDEVLTVAASTVPGKGLSDVSSGGSTSCALKDGSAYCWGYNGQGQVGNGTTTDPAEDRGNRQPSRVSRLTNISAIAVGDAHVCAVAAGLAYCWGRNRAGDLGTGSSGGATVPTQVQGLTSVTSISTAFDHSCAISQGRAYCWGSNDEGALGDGTTNSATTPVMVKGLENVTSIAAGDEHTCAVADGAAYCWGHNDAGQLGNGNQIDSASPVKVNGVEGPVAVSAGGEISCAINSSGVPRCWGFAPGNNSWSDVASPVQPDGIATATAASSGAFHSCLISDKVPYCWSDNASGGLGDGTWSDSPAPVQVTGLSATTSITAGDFHSCAIDDGVAYCWGANDDGQLGTGTWDPSTTPIKVEGLP